MKVHIVNFRGREAGFFFNLDFMFGLPGQSLAHWQATLERPGELAQAVGTLFQDPETQVVTGTVRAERPGMPILVTSGHGAPDLLPTGGRFVSKPYDNRKVVTLLSELVAA